VVHTSRDARDGDVMVRLVLDPHQELVLLAIGHAWLTFSIQVLSNTLRSRTAELIFLGEDGDGDDLRVG
jgi:hypothetical protein